LNRMGTWMKCGECGLTFLWDEPKPKQPTFQASPYVYVDLMERDEEEPESDGLPIVIPQDLDDEEGDEDDER